MPPYAVHVLYEDEDPAEIYHDAVEHPSSSLFQPATALPEELSSCFQESSPCGVEEHCRQRRRVHFHARTRVRTIPRVPHALQSDVWYSSAERNAMIQIQLDREAAASSRKGLSSTTCRRSASSSYRPLSSLSTKNQCSEVLLLQGILELSMMAAIGLEFRNEFALLLQQE